jgi:hypothetical protein
MTSPLAEVAMIEWVEAAGRVAALELTASRRATLERVVDEVAAEVIRRIGLTYTVEELARLYQDSAKWCKATAQETTDQVWAHDLSLVQGAAFDRVSRWATDYR